VGIGRRDPEKIGYLDAMKIGIVSIFVDDPVAAFHFYTEVLGFQKKEFAPEKWISIVVSAQDPGGTQLMLEPNHNSIAKRYQTALYAKSLPCMVFTAKNVKQEFERLTGLGVKFTKEPKKTKEGIQATFEDGQGNLILLMEEAGRPQPTRLQ
jgi:predicted enzyme related to lactoylglutathione lyase